MPILLAKVNTNSGPDSPNRWLAGEIVDVFEDGHEFGAAEVPSAGNFHHITITNKTFEEVGIYLQKWTHDPTVVQLQQQGDDRRIEVTSTVVSVTGKNAFTREGVEALFNSVYNAITTYRRKVIIDQNQTYIDVATSKDERLLRIVQVLTDNVSYILNPTNIAYFSHTRTSFKFDITAANDEKEIVIAQIDEAVRTMQYARRRWGINAAGMAFLAANGGTVSGTGAQVAVYLRDGLLD